MTYSNDSISCNTMLKQSVIFFIFNCLVAISTDQNKLKILLKHIRRMPHKDLQIRTTNGVVQGKESKTAYTGTTFYSFQGIPFAKTPTGKRRFADPEPADNWKGVLDATREKDICVQTTSWFGRNGSEDCLYLNMYTTMLPRGNNAPLLPVMIWIYGGGFIDGGALYNLFKPDFFLNEKVVYASVQYRLGVLGFLSTGDDVISGNFGLKDQVMAIKWIHKNARAFGGDPKKITAFGVSAGGVSISYLAQTPHLNGILSGVVIQSGSSLAQFGLIRNPKKDAVAYANSMGVKSQDSTVILRELRNKSVKQLMSFGNLTNPMQCMFNNLMVVFGPVIEERHKNALITEKTHLLLQSGKFNRIPHVIGITSEEGKLLLEFGYSQTIPLMTSLYDTNPKNYVPLDMNVKQNLEMRLGRKIKDYYSAHSSNVYNKIRFVSDAFFVRPAVEHVRLIHRFVPTYFYELAYEGSFTYVPGQEKIPGVAHIGELKYIFGEDNDLVVSKEDVKTRLRLIKLWTNFAKYGNPTPKPDPLLDNVVWDKVSSDKRVNYLHIDSKLQNKIDPHKKDMRFWDCVYKQYGNPPYGTYK